MIFSDVFYVSCGVLNRRRCQNRYHRPFYVYDAVYAVVTDSIRCHSQNPRFRPFCDDVCDDGGVDSAGNESKNESECTHTHTRTQLLYYFDIVFSS